jgi:hypothetical protein
VGSTSFTKAQFDNIFADFNKANEGGPVQQRKTIGENFVGAYMLSQQALAQGLDKDPEVQRELEAARIQILSNAEYEKLENQAKPSVQQVAAYYSAHPSDFDEVDIRRIFVYKQTPSSQGHGLPAADAKARAELIQKVLSSGGDAKSLIASTKDAVDTDPLTFRRGDLPEGMDKAFDMKVGECSQIADTADVYSMFCVVRKGRLSLAQATPIIEKKIQAQTLRQEMDALKNKTGIWMDQQYFSGPLSASSSAGPSSQPQTQNK